MNTNYFDLADTKGKWYYIELTFSILSFGYQYIAA